MFYLLMWFYWVSVLTTGLTLTILVSIAYYIRKQREADKAYIAEQTKYREDFVKKIQGQLTQLNALEGRTPDFDGPSSVN